MEVFIYIDSWEYTDDYELERFYGHPIAGKVYKAEKIYGNKYKVDLPSIDSAAGIILVQEGQKNEIEYCNYMFHEINENNIAKLDISEDDLDMIIEAWNEENATERKSLTLDTEEQEKKELPDKIDLKEEMENIEAFNEISENLNIILENDKNVFRALRDIVRVLSEDYKTGDKGMAMIRSIIENIKRLK